MKVWDRVASASHEEAFPLPLQAEWIGSMDDLLGSPIMLKVSELSDDLTLEEIVELGEDGA